MSGTFVCRAFARVTNASSLVATPGGISATTSRSTDDRRPGRRVVRVRMRAAELYVRTVYNRPEFIARVARGSAPLRSPMVKPATLVDLTWTGDLVFDAAT